MDEVGPNTPAQQPLNEGPNKTGPESGLRVTAVDRDIFSHDLTKQLLALERMRAEKATGATPRDFKYGKAEGVRKSDLKGSVYVTVGGNEYIGQESWGPLDGDPYKLTVLVNAKDPEKPDAPDNWTKVWFDVSDISGK